MIKKVAVINDLSGFGRTSLSAAMPTLSVMGMQVVPLPTSVLSAQTGFDRYDCEDLSAVMERFTACWQQVHVRFEGILTGFVSSVRQIDAILRFVASFHYGKTLLVVDPVLGDDGAVYDMFSETLLDRMKLLSAKADVVTPNLTELCLLLGASHEELLAIDDAEVLFPKVEALARRLMESGSKQVVVTGVYHRPRNAEQSGTQVANLAISKDSAAWVSHPFNGTSYSGTGDLFAAILIGALLQGDDLAVATKRAASFIYDSIEVTQKYQDDPRHGICFEPQLGQLLR